MAVEKNEVKVAKKAKEAVHSLGKEYLEKERGFIEGLPIFISANGLLQALTYMADKQRSFYDQFEKHLWSDSDPIAQVIKLSDIREYISRQKRAIDFAVWVKYLANALYPPKKQGKKEEANAPSLPTT